MQIATTDITWEIVVADVDVVASELDFIRVERSQDQQRSKDGRLQIQLISRQAGGVRSILKSSAQLETIKATFDHIERFD